VNRVLAANVCLWGIVTACTSSVQTSRQLLALRTVLGLFESAVNPSLILLTSAWYRREPGAARFGVWFCGLGIGQILGGLVSYGFQHAGTKTALEGWRLMFLVIGVGNTIMSIFVFRLSPSPTEAKFLTASEKDRVHQMLRDDHSGTGPKVLRTRSLFEAALDAQTWLLVFVTVLTSMSAGVIVYFSAAIIQSFGFNSKQAALLNMPSGIVSIVATLMVTFIVANGYPRWLGMVIASGVATLGACLMSFSPAKNKIALLSGVYLVNTAPSALTLVLSTAAANYRGYTRKIAGSAIIAGSFSFANIVSPQTFQAKDAPQ
jgi:MFS family permease